MLPVRQRQCRQGANLLCGGMILRNLNLLSSEHYPVGGASRETSGRR